MLLSDQPGKISTRENKWGRSREGTGLWKRRETTGSPFWNPGYISANKYRNMQLVILCTVPSFLSIIIRDVVSVSRRSRDVVSRRLGLVETWEGLGLDLISDWKSNVSVSSRSRTIGSRLQANMHSFLLHCKIARFECNASILFTDSQVSLV